MQAQWCQDAIDLKKKKKAENVEESNPETDKIREQIQRELVRDREDDKHEK